MKHSIYNVAMIAMILGLAGCNKVIDWGKDQFKQGEKIEKYTDEPQHHVRSITLYDQFTTEGMFDALWLSDDVRTAFANVHALKRGHNEEQRTVFLRRQLEENNHFISFYVLSPYEKPLGEPNSEWVAFLEINGTSYRPIEVKAVDLSPEYQAFFGKKFTRFKEKYSIRFDAKDIEDRLLIKNDTKNIRLVFRSNENEASLVWDLVDGKLANNTNKAVKKNVENSVALS